MLQAFFPKNRGQWKAFSSWEPPEKGVRERAPKAEKPGEGEVQVKRGYSWSEQLGIVIAALVDAGNVQWVNWTKDVSANSKSTGSLAGTDAYGRRSFQW